jgi:hypothetical protein
MRILQNSLLLGCLAALVIPCTTFADDTSATVADVAELKVLDRLRGHWTGTLDGGNTELTLRSRWILDGHVLETKFTLDGGLQGLLLRTYDAEDDQYVFTYMDAAGSVLVMTGSWDEDQQTLRTQGTNGGKSITFTTRFIDEKTTKWEVAQSSAGAEASQIGGTNRRIRR